MRTAQCSYLRSYYSLAATGVRLAGLSDGGIRFLVSLLQCGMFRDCGCSTLWGHRCDTGAPGRHV
eukprot:1160732-Pelagomonas_calceolata.AAC.1